jgi:hypothetical protein
MGPLLAALIVGCLVAAAPAAAAGTGTIAGTVTNNAAVPAPLANVCVYAYHAQNGSSAGSTTTGANGQFTIPNLQTGSYKVEFYDCSGAGYVTQYYDGKGTLAQATAVSVTAPNTSSGINAKLAMGAKIKGTVTNNAASPMPLSNMCVAAFTPSSFSAIAFAHTNSLGNYMLRGLPTGSYVVEFYDCTGTYYIAQYYDNQPNFGNGKLVPVTAPNATTGINAKLVRGGNISGTVTDNAASPKPLANICVEVYTSSNAFVMGGSTTANGQYTIASVPPGSYKLEFVDCKNSLYVTQYYSKKTSLANANAVSVAAASTTGSINAQLVHI